jgi:hypothetical protein
MATLSYPGKLLKTWLQDLRLPGAPRSTMRWRPTYHSLHCRKIHQTASCQPASPLTNRSELKPERFIKSIAGFQWFNWVQICSGQGIQGIHGLEISRATVGGGRSFCAHFEARPQMKAAARVASSIIVHQHTSAPALTGAFFCGAGSRFCRPLGCNRASSQTGGSWLQILNVSSMFRRMKNVLLCPRQDNWPISSPWFLHSPLRLSCTRKTGCEQGQADSLWEFGRCRYAFMCQTLLCHIFFVDGEKTSLTEKSMLPRLHGHRREAHRHGHTHRVSCMSHA